MLDVGERDNRGWGWVGERDNRDTSWRRGVDGGARQSGHVVFDMGGATWGGSATWGSATWG